MVCKKCETNNSPDAKFCTKCGTEISKTITGSVDSYFAKQEHGCQICGSLAPTRKVEFSQNIGYLLARSESSIKGRLCKNCIDKEFRKKTLITLFFGWWGVISFIMTIIFLLSNFYNFIPTIGMKKEG